MNNSDEIVKLFQGDEFIDKLCENCTKEKCRFTKEERQDMNLKGCETAYRQARPIINYHRIVGEDVDPEPVVTYASFNCPRGVFRCGDNVLCGDCKGFTETCQNCARLKVLVADVWKLLNDSYHPAHWTGDHRDRYAELEVRIKQEGIV